MLPDDIWANTLGGFITAVFTGFWTLFLAPLTQFTAEVFGFLDTLLPW